jgi:hypothetical protein
VVARAVAGVEELAPDIDDKAQNKTLAAAEHPNYIHSMSVATVTSSDSPYPEDPFRYGGRVWSRSKAIVERSGDDTEMLVNYGQSALQYSFKPQEECKYHFQTIVYSLSWQALHQSLQQFDHHFLLHHEDRP